MRGARGPGAAEVPALRRVLNAAAMGLALALALCLAACATPEVPEYVETPVEDLYNDALDLLENQEYRTAARAFDEVERQHPYSAWATRAQMMSAYAYYMQRDYDDAILAAQRFLELHPGSSTPLMSFTWRRSAFTTRFPTCAGTRA